METYKSAKSQNFVKGKKGETVAVKFLIDNGYKIIQQNYKNKIGEIDIIAEKDNRIIFIEVKYRQTAKFGYPRESVNYYKQKKIKQVALTYLKQKSKTDALIRFDVIEILDEKLTHLIAAF